MRLKKRNLASKLNTAKAVLGAVEQGVKIGTNLYSAYSRGQKAGAKRKASTSSSGNKRRRVSGGLSTPMRDMTIGSSSYSKYSHKPSKLFKGYKISAKASHLYKNGALNLVQDGGR